MNHKKGLTLVEVLVVVTILSVLALSVYTVFKSGIDAWSRSEARLDIYQNARVVLDQISRELAGAFVDGADAKLEESVDGGAGSDTLTFVTDFADSIYKIRYHIETDATDATKKNLVRDYINYGVSHTPAKTYANTDYDEGIDFVHYTKNTMADRIKFSYLPVMAAPGGITDWDTSPPTAIAWTDAALPEAVKIVLTLKDANNKDYIFETIVYLPNSEE